MTGDKFCNQGETQARTVSLACNERLKQVVAQNAGDARPVVDHLNLKRSSLR